MLPQMKPMSWNFYPTDLAEVFYCPYIKVTLNKSDPFVIQNLLDGDFIETQLPNP